MLKSIKLTIKLTSLALTITLCSCGENKTEPQVQTEAKEHLSGKTYETLFADFVP